MNKMARKHRIGKGAPRRGRKMRVRQKNLRRVLAGAGIGGGLAHLTGRNVGAGAAVGAGVGLLL